ncbi:MAG: hypothetical protein PWR21_869 [Methanoculleus sp.]|nr:hypothetical protein [Methanoculleus sp.]
MRQGTTGAKGAGTQSSTGKSRERPCYRSHQIDNRPAFPGKLPADPDVPQPPIGRGQCPVSKKRPRFDHRTAPCRLAPRRGPAPVSRIAGQKRRLDTENAPQHAPIEAGPDLKTGSASQPREQRGRHKPYAAIPNMGRERSASPAEFERSRTPQDTRFPQLPPRLPGTAVQPAPLK